MLNLTMIFHCHQPVGNFDSVFEMALKKCYLPMLKLLKSHPLIKCGLHFSGPLLEWIEANTPEHLDLMASMAENGQVEFLSGGFFEPLLATIPVRDIKGQVEMMNDFISRKFGQTPTGFWLTERVWDPNLPLTLEGTGMKYTVVDDTHLCYAGLGEHEIYGRYVTEKEGRTMSLLATPMEMRYFIPFKPVDDVINHLKWLNDQGRCLVVYGDDGEKFGVWPGTHEWVIKQGWLEKFFQSVQENRDWLEMILPGKVIETSSPLGRVYLPQASYEEMTEWALAPSQSEQLEDIITVLKNEGRWEEHARAIELLDDASRRGIAAGGSGRAAHAYARVVEAFGLWQQREPEAALAALEDLKRYYAIGSVRWMLGVVLMDLERWEEAIPYLQAWWWSTFSFMNYNLARAYEHTGEYEKAREEYAFFVEAWQDADPELQPWVEDARRALARLTSER